MIHGLLTILFAALIATARRRSALARPPASRPRSGGRRRSGVRPSTSRAPRHRSSPADAAADTPGSPPPTASAWDWVALPPDVLARVIQLLEPVARREQLHVMTRGSPRPSLHARGSPPPSPR